MKCKFLYIILFIFLTSCIKDQSNNPDNRVAVGRDYYLEVLNGYEIWSMNSNEIVLSNHNNIQIVGPNIINYGHNDRHIYGEVINIRTNESIEMSYFTVDTITGDVKNILDKSKWLDILRNYGVISDAPPKLYSP